MPRGKPSVYAYLCEPCGHLSSGHFLVDDGDLRAGPYQCQRCACQRPQDGPDIPLTRRQFEDWERQRDAQRDGDVCDGPLTGASE